MNARKFRPEQYPVAIVQDRYTGVYSGGAWLAIAAFETFAPGSADMDRICYVMDGAHGGDIEAMQFWSEESEAWWIGKGDTPDAALADLDRRMDIKDGCLPKRTGFQK